MMSLSLTSCAVFQKGSDSDFALPGCETAWVKVVNANVINNLKNIIVNDCSEMYKHGWRLPIDKNNSGSNKPETCRPAWEKLEKAGQLENAKYMVTHNCPVFYRHGWIIPPN